MIFQKLNWYFLRFYLTNTRIHINAENLNGRLKQCLKNNFKNPPPLPPKKHISAQFKVSLYLNFIITYVK